jgi:pseudouridine-5'-phosphate glycosidase
MSEYLDVRPQVETALAEGRPVVALESALIAHGLPAPDNLETAQAMAGAVRAAGAVPATIGLLEGKAVVGLSQAEIARFAGEPDIVKVSTGNLATALAQGRAGATTVAATLACAARAGIRVLASGGIGGVHRGSERSLDISADLSELARAPVAVVCSGAKAILDLARTLEVLETNGVPVLGYGTDEFPAFFARGSGLRLETRVDAPEAAAAVMRAQWALGLPGGLLVAVPLPDDAALDRGEVEAWTAHALAEAEARKVTGKDLTPFLLARLAELSGGRTLAANKTLLAHNAGLGGRIAAAYAGRTAG